MLIRGLVLHRNFLRLKSHESWLLFYMRCHFFWPLLDLTTSRVGKERPVDSFPSRRRGSTFPFETEACTCQVCTDRPFSSQREGPWMFRPPPECLLHPPLSGWEILDNNVKNKRSRTLFCISLQMDQCVQREGPTFPVCGSCIHEGSSGIESKFFRCRDLMRIKSNLLVKRAGTTK